MYDPLGNEVNIHKNHFAALSAVDPLHGALAASSPFWMSTDTMKDSRIDFSEFRRDLELARNRLQNLAAEIEASMTRGDEIGTETRIALESAYTHFQLARISPQAWQDIHGEDLDLIQRVRDMLKNRF